ncbi:Ser/Thr protein kinase RdoA involved in Cpx stress response, MazF antagonist [Franzmannia pantelleriensis]|uniref:Stress response kinase A n=1 Tax=Franzmannia pantelleriensis TaxID=48727 RepID=A0A1G9VMN6_9GAMM|nr:serine/threonine protein kinase [Halomonas pantelleriensis]SDM73065.1 Ser/Thr protein kinase RdoA involved in Cpx stress response, MazF antagonist [Halomonas pantelleriensis]
MADTSHPFDRLSPATIVDAVESLGFWLPGEPFALNSYENRVFLLSDDERRRWVAKFYRPGRWSDAQIQEEHDFLLELAEANVPVAAPWRNAAGETLHHWEGFRLTLFRQVSGQAPELENPEHLFALGELIGKVHAVGAKRDFDTRLSLDLTEMVEQARATVLVGPWLTRRQRDAYARISAELAEMLREHSWPAQAAIRLHGDCHLGNMLGRDASFSLVDFDDALMGPRVQDLWMLLTAQTPEELQWQLSEILEGYEQEADFPRGELALIEPLRTLRLLRHSAWLTARWEDPAFPRAFPWAAEEGYWDQHIRSLEQQRQALEQHPRWLAAY